MSASGAPFPGGSDTTTPDVPLWFWQVAAVTFILAAAFAVVSYRRQGGGVGRMGMLFVSASLYAIAWPITFAVLAAIGLRRLWREWNG
ncbi:hypothetical protein ASG12_10635 [Williamsia sp. Leaf354]|uniref:hypothetical protein n=1 Tax=Williamsia sp. Leaf354 TaxID=1736349 RepID=UPI0006FBC487|nr:hypothetical protein [Williamsia sp. Leaf354]KQR98812.1 hypothetical protein ASG12_10635 [Williamsia sp. Leaf354]